MTKTYTVTPLYRKSFISVEYYDKELSTGKLAIICEHLCYRYGEMEVELTEEEVEEIKDKEDIHFDNYESTFVEAIDGSNIYYELQNQDSFTIEELDEIKKSISSNNNEESEHDCVNIWIDNCNTEYMEEYGDWNLTDCLYSIRNGYKLELTE